jgi:hypothetical protein
MRRREVETDPQGRTGSYDPGLLWPSFLSVSQLPVLSTLGVPLAQGQPHIKTSGVTDDDGGQVSSRHWQYQTTGKTSLSHTAWA